MIGSQPRPAEPPAPGCPTPGMHLHRGLAIIALLALSACGSPAPDASDGRASASASAPASTSVRLLTDEPVLLPDRLDGASWVLPAAAAEIDGTLHAWLVGFGDARGDHRGWHATSTDRLSWELADEDPFASLDVELADPGPIPTSVLADGDGGWVMFFRGDVSTAGGGSIWRATASDPGGPWVADPEPILAPGEATAWDGLAVDGASVVRTDDAWLMLYVGTDGPSSGAIGLATSEDGMTWSRHPDPVATPGLCGEWDARSLQMPRLVEDGDRLLVVYGGFPLDGDTMSVGAADSRDGGLTWTCLTPQPMLVDTELPNSTGIHSVTVAPRAETIDLLIESLEEDHSTMWVGHVEGLPQPE